MGGGGLGGGSDENEITALLRYCVDVMASSREGGFYFPDM